MRRKIDCPSCGANLKPDAYYCDYCGIFFENKQNELEAEQLKRINENHNSHKVDVYDTKDAKANEYKQEWEENKQSKELTDAEIDATWEIQNSKLNGILFSYLKDNAGGKGASKFVVLTVMMIIGGIIMGPFIIIPLIIFGGMFNANWAVNEKLKAFYRAGDYKKGYAQLEMINHQKPNIDYIKQMILLNYYRLDNKTQAKKQIKLLSKMQHIKDPHIVEVANKLDVLYKAL